MIASRIEYFLGRGLLSGVGGGRGDVLFRYSSSMKISFFFKVMKKCPLLLPSLGSLLNAPAPNLLSCTTPG